MNNPLLSAAVTGVLKSLLENGMVEAGVTTAVGTEILVSAIAPDRVKTGAEERPQINLFQHHLSQRGLARSGKYAAPIVGAEELDTLRLPNLQLEMFYLVTAYGTEDFQTEILMGYAVSLLDNHAHIGRDEFAAHLQRLTGGSQRGKSASLRALNPAELSKDVETMRTTGQAVTPQDMLNLWSTYQVAYRPSSLFRVILTLNAAVENTTKK